MEEWSEGYNVVGIENGEGDHEPRNGGNLWAGKGKKTDSPRKPPESNVTLFMP